METTLLTKVAMLLTMCMLIGGAGAYIGKNIVRSLGTFLVLAVVWLIGTFFVFMAAHASPGAGIAALMIWTFVSGLVIAPAIQAYSEDLGWHTVFLAFMGTGGVMAVLGIIGMFSGINFGFLGGILAFALFGLIIWGVIACFVRMSREVNIIQAIIGMVVFAGYFLFDFWRLSKSVNTWEAAVQLTMAIYLDFVNFFLYLLQFLSNSKKHSSLLDTHHVAQWVGDHSVAMCNAAGHHAVNLVSMVGHHIQPALSAIGLC